jgi:hypothetical protein
MTDIMLRVLKTGGILVWVSPSSNETKAAHAHPATYPLQLAKPQMVS